VKGDKMKTIFTTLVAMVLAGTLMTTSPANAHHWGGYYYDYDDAGFIRCRRCTTMRLEYWLGE
jgi:hypothetical protein